ncbi:UNVERIFIED_CONTAM: hypothetical protein Sradi_3520500 [Sesamum radiatum]|uniref:Uncharacterized protein n=1 Tax=Sesamum radiatum TaxID=300843 RepID=A0AAW2QEJ4_SESRA
MPPKNTQALEEAVLAISEWLSKISASMEQRHKSLAAAVSNIQHHLATLPSPTLPPQFSQAPHRFHLTPARHRAVSTFTQTS